MNASQVISGKNGNQLRYSLVVVSVQVPLQKINVLQISISLLASLSLLHTDNFVIPEMNVALL